MFDTTHFQGWYKCIDGSECRGSRCCHEQSSNRAMCPPDRPNMCAGIPGDEETFCVNIRHTVEPTDHCCESWDCTSNDPLNPGEAEKGGLQPCNLNITGVIHRIDGVYRTKIAKSNGCLNEDENKEYNFLHYLGVTGTRHGISNFAGCVATAMFIVLALGGLETVRRVLFEWFYKSHVIATVICFCALAFHYDYGGLDDASPVILVMLFDYAWRFWLCKSGDATVEDVEVISMSGAGGDIIKLVLSHPVTRITEPGQYCFMRIGQLGHYQWHPFSIMTTPGFSDRNEGKFVIYIRDFGTWTSELIKLGPTLLHSPPQQQGRKAAETTELKAQSKPRVSIDGMYGRITVPFETYPSLIITCGGIGCTPMFSVLMHLSEQPPGRRPDHVCFVWSVRERELLRCFEPELARCRDIGWDIRVHLTSKKHPAGKAGGATEHEMESLVHTSEAERQAGPGTDALEDTVLPGRPNLSEIFSSTQQRLKRMHGTTPTACAVLTCGPRALVNGTKAACVMKSDDNVTFEFHSEEFEW